MTDEPQCAKGAAVSGVEYSTDHGAVAVEPTNWPFVIPYIKFPDTPAYETFESTVALAPGALIFIVPPFGLNPYVLPTDMLLLKIVVPADHASGEVPKIPRTTPVIAVEVAPLNLKYSMFAPVLICPIPPLDVKYKFALATGIVVLEAVMAADVVNP